MARSGMRSKSTRNISRKKAEGRPIHPSSSASQVPLRDTLWGQICRFLAENGLEMHTPMVGETWVRPKQEKRKRFQTASAMSSDKELP